MDTTRPATGVVHSLIGTLSSGLEEEQIAQVSRTLGRMGASAEPAIIALVDVVKRNPITPTADENTMSIERHIPWVCGAAALAAMEAIALISPRKGLESIEPLCHDSDPQIRFRAMLPLHVIQEPTNLVIPRLVHFCRDSEAVIRRDAVMALWSFGSLDHDILLSLVPLTHDSDMLVRIRVDYLLSHQLPGHQRTLPEATTTLVTMLVRAVEGDMPGDAIKTIAMMKCDAPAFADRLMALLRSNEWLTMPAIASVSFALSEASRHHPSLLGLIRSALRDVAVPGNKKACLVRDSFDVHLSLAHVEERKVGWREWLSRFVPCS